MKKGLTFLLLLVTMTGTFCPCCNKDNCCNDKTASTNNSNNHKSEGNCSPFITCGTCPGFVLSAKAVHIPSIIGEKPVHYSILISLTLSTYTASMLQPPRIA